MNKKLFNVSYDDYNHHALVVADSEEGAVKTLCNDKYYNHDKESLLKMINLVNTISMDEDRVLYDTCMDN